MPLKIDGNAMSTMVISIDAISMPSVVFESATHLYCTISEVIRLIFGGKGFVDYKKIVGECCSSLSCSLDFLFNVSVIFYPL